MAPSGSASGTEPGDPGLGAHVGGVAGGGHTLMFIVGGIHQADRNSDTAVW